MQGEAHGLTVTGRGKAIVTPDRAVVTFSVTTTGKTAQIARKGGDAIMNAVFEAARQAGVEDKDMNTGQYAVSPTWSTSTKSKPSAVNGYLFKTKLAVVVRKLDQVPDVIDAMSGAGGNMEGVSFQADDALMESMENQAIQAALMDAKEKATAIATTAGVGLGPPIDISHDQNHQGGGRMMKMAALRSESVGAAAVIAGDQEVSVSVTILYEIVKISA